MSKLFKTVTQQNCKFSNYMNPNPKLPDNNDQFMAFLSATIATTWLCPHCPDKT